MRFTLVRLTALSMAIALSDAVVKVVQPEDDANEGAAPRKETNSERAAARRNRRTQNTMKTSISITPGGRMTVIKQKKHHSQYYRNPPRDEEAEIQGHTYTYYPPVNPPVEWQPPIMADHPDTISAEPAAVHDDDIYYAEYISSANETNSGSPIITYGKPAHYQHRSKKHEAKMEKITRDDMRYGASGKGKHWHSPKGEKSSKKSKSWPWSEKSMMMSKSGKGMGKGQKSMGKGKGNGGMPSPPVPTYSPSPTDAPATAMPTPAECNSEVANLILTSSPQAITKNPSRCCAESGPTAVFVTHALQDDTTASGFEPFWDTIYQTLLETGNRANVCFVMTGVRDNVDSAALTGVLTNVLNTVSRIPVVPAILSTDPTPDVTLIQTIRSISNNDRQPSIGIFNAGYDNIIIEAIVTGQERLPFIGYLNEAEFGRSAGKVTLQLLAGVPAKPLCFNARVGQVNIVQERCASYYTEVTDTAIVPEGGVACSAQSNPNELLQQLLQADANAVWSHVDCCSVVAEAVSMAEVMGRPIVMGCMDGDTTGGNIDFVTEQPIQLQAYSAMTWVTFPVVQEKQGMDGRGEMWFPSLQSLVNTAVYNVILAS